MSRPLGATSGELPRSGGFDQPKLGQRGHAVVEADLLHDLAVDHLQHRGAGEVHPAAGRSRKTADQKIVEGGASMGATACPLNADVVALCDYACGAPEIEVGEPRTEIGHERLDVVAATTGFV